MVPPGVDASRGVWATGDGGTRAVRLGSGGGTASEPTAGVLLADGDVRGADPARVERGQALVHDRRRRPAGRGEDRQPRCARRLPGRRTRPGPPGVRSGPGRVGTQPGRHLDGWGTLTWQLTLGLAPR